MIFLFNILFKASDLDASLMSDVAQAPKNVMNTPQVKELDAIFFDVQLKPTKSDDVLF